MKGALVPDLFAGRRVLVTGAGRGIGHAVAAGFAAHGAQVLVHLGISPRGDRDTLFPDLPRADAARITTCTADLADLDAINDLAETVAARLGGLDILVNNAGTMVARVPVDALTADHFARVVDLNARAVLLLTSRLLPLLRHSAHAAIINTSSISATTGGSPGSSVYSGAKAFVSTITRSLARELAPDGIRVNAISPGTIMTDFHRRYSTAEKLAAAERAIPLGRLGTANDCLGAFLFLASDRLSGYITGQVLEVNGGQLMC